MDVQRESLVCHTLYSKIKNMLFFVISVIKLYMMNMFPEASEKRRLDALQKPIITMCIYMILARFVITFVSSRVWNGLNLHMHTSH